MNIKIALIQRPPEYLNLEVSLQIALGIIKDCADQNVQLIVFPETWLPGYPLWLDYAPNAAIWNQAGANELFSLLFENSLSIPGPHCQALQQSAQERNIWIVMGCHEKMGHTLYNTMLFISPQGDLLPHRKLMPTYTEKLIWGMGDASTLKTISTPWGAMGGLICWEHWMPFPRAVLHAELETIHIAQWPMVNELHQMASRHYAFEGQTWVLACGTVIGKREILAGAANFLCHNSPGMSLLRSLPDQPDHIHSGGSAIIAPDSQYLVSPIFDCIQPIIATIPLDKHQSGHMTMDCSGHYSRPDLFTLIVDRAPQKLIVDRHE